MPLRLSSYYRYAIFLLLLALLAFGWWRYTRTTIETQVISGLTMGSIAYHIRYIGTPTIHSSQVDSVLQVFNAHFSTYEPDSEISTFNRLDTLVFQDSLWRPLLALSRQVHAETWGAFDPTLGPLIDFWGFGSGASQQFDSTISSTRVAAYVDSLRACVGMHLLLEDSMGLGKQDKRLRLELSAIAKGYAVDVLADWLRKQQVHRFLIDIGGELTAEGNNAMDTPWAIGIQNPLTPWASQALAILRIPQGGVASSGNYRNIRHVGDTIYAHTLDPNTGYPKVTDLLGVTLWVREGHYPTAYADALATACMVMGKVEAMRLVEQLPDVEALLIVRQPAKKLHPTGAWSVKSLYISASTGAAAACQAAAAPVYDFANNSLDVSAF